jgi:hypothetical protein
MAKLKQCMRFVKQADNCWRENKNRYVFAVCSWLVAKKLFREVRVSFLMVGHTHEDLDRLFQKIKMRLLLKGARTVQELADVIMDSIKECDVHLVMHVRYLVVFKVVSIQSLHCDFECDSQFCVPSHKTLM